MQEVIDRVFIENVYPGVTLGAIIRENGLVLVDSPFRQDDTRAWRAALLHLNGGTSRILVQLDTHIDRSMGAKAMECTILSHIEAANIFQTRPASIKAQTLDAGAEWETYNGLSSIRWGTPHITFSDHISIHWDEKPVEIDYKPGIANGSVWVDLPEEKVLFIGDMVVCSQPPFLSDADLPLWINHLESLFEPRYQDYLLIGGRDGLVTLDNVQNQMNFLIEVHNRVQELADQKASLEVVSHLVPDLMKILIDVPAKLYDLHEKRLTYGLQMYYAHRYLDKNNKKETH